MPARLDDLAKSFARHLRAEAKAPRTVVLYGMSVRMFSEWLQAQGRPATVDELSRAAIREWLATLAETHSASTVRTRYRGLFRFAAWAAAEGEVPANPMAGLSPPVAPMKPVPVLSDEQLTALIRTCKGRTFIDRRDEAMIRVLLDTGVRVSELCALAVEGVDLDGGMALVTGKGNKIRPVYFGSRTTAALDRYIRARGSHRWAHTGVLFLSQRGPLSPDGVREIIRARGDAAGVEGLHPHRFRHTFAHDFLLNGGQGTDLKRLAGWSSDVMLERYGASGADVRAKAAAQRLRRGDRV